MDLIYLPPQDRNSWSPGYHFGSLKVIATEGTWVQVTLLGPFRIFLRCAVYPWVGSTLILGTCFVMWEVLGPNAYYLWLTVHGDNCQFRGKDSKSELRLEGEPVVLRCPMVLHSDTSSSSHSLLTWSKLNSSQLIPGDEPRMWVKGDTLWVLPAVQQDSGTYICTFR